MKGRKIERPKPEPAGTAAIQEPLTKKTASAQCALRCTEHRDLCRINDDPASHTLFELYGEASEILRHHPGDHCR